MADIKDYHNEILPDYLKIKDVNKDYIKSLQRTPPITVHLSNYRHHISHSSEHVNIDKNGIRYTPHITPNKLIYMFGGSNFYGYCLEDRHSLPYLLQTAFNNEYKVFNYSKCANDIVNLYFTILSVNPKNSIILLETGLYSQLSELGEYKYDLETYVKISNNFINFVFFKIYKILKNNGNKIYCIDSNNSDNSKVVKPNITNIICHPDNIKKHILTDSTGIKHLNATGNYLFSLYLKDNLTEDNISDIIFDESINSQVNMEFINMVKKHSDINYRLLKKKSEFKNNFKRFEPYKVESNKSKGIIFLTANPFTYGHQKLIEYAANKMNVLYLSSLIGSNFYFSYEERQEMILRGTQHLKNVVYIPPTEIEHSPITFNSYIYKDESPTDINEDMFDFENGCDISIQIMKILGITHRFFGEETTDIITKKYFDDFVKLCKLKYDWITVDKIPRISTNEDKIISGTYCRKLIDNKSEELKSFVPDIIYNYLINEYIKH